jgi:hypothetical protein
MQNKQKTYLYILLTGSLTLNTWFFIHFYLYKIINHFKEAKQYEKQITNRIYYDLDRNELYKKLSTIEGDFIFIGDSHIQEFPINEFFSKLPTRNRGINGDNITGIISRINSYLKPRPAKIFLQIGINDLAQKMHPEVLIKITWH